eukprot:CAMPEP_0183793356 /NCGR_PEP_ID=MMETSP0803_2-20130417/3166_1 /TAXON_ID=195967 /ORGANISM="Crustomastix stigmata, Strain CCMP3273" /LENGTH=270 /DNA_ID=CAMNT_0026037731 /DNA_START=53 /DNA_END=864 /DNA_ORIENTATION=-
MEDSAEAKEMKRQLKIKKGSLGRIAKELAGYTKEEEKELAKLEQMKADGKDSHDIKHQENVHAESKMMLPDSRQRLSGALDDMEAYLEEIKGAEEGMEEWEEYKEATKLYAELDEATRASEWAGGPAIAPHRASGALWRASGLRPPGGGLVEHVRGEGRDLGFTQPGPEGALARGLARLAVAGHLSLPVCYDVLQRLHVCVPVLLQVRRAQGLVRREDVATGDVAAGARAREQRSGVVCEAGGAADSSAAAAAAATVAAATGLRGSFAAP